MWQVFEGGGGPFFAEVRVPKYRYCAPNPHPAYPAGFGSPSANRPRIWAPLHEYPVCPTMTHYDTAFTIFSECEDSDDAGIEGGVRGRGMGV